MKYLVKNKSRSFLSVWSTSWQLPVSQVRAHPTCDWRNNYSVCGRHKQFGQERTNGQEPYIIPILLICVSEIKFHSPIYSNFIFTPKFCKNSIIQVIQFKIIYIFFNT